MTVPGLVEIVDAVTRDEEAEIIARVMGLPIARKRDQARAHVRYGSAIYGMTEGVMPPWLAALRVRVMPEADHCTVNVWRPGDELAAHIDRGGDAVCVLNLGEVAAYTFHRGSQIFDYRLARRSVLEMTGDVRHLWTHEILPSHRGRVSLVFRDS